MDGAEQETFPEELADALVGVQRLLRRRLRAGLTGPRLRGAEVELLRLVEARPGIGVSDAAKELCLAGNSVSTLVNQLVKDGYLIRETDPADRRAARLRLTERAEARLQRLAGAARRAGRAAGRPPVAADDRAACARRSRPCAPSPSACTRRPRGHDDAHKRRGRRPSAAGRATPGVAATAWSTPSARPRPSTGST